jgi:hypothetical protein
VRQMYGVVIALVTDLDDPDSQGRVKLSFPWLAEDGADSGWAPIVRPLAGKDRGFYYMPELEDEALVAFEHGDINHPIVLGFLHNGVDLPPTKSIDTHVRRLRSVAGHQLELDDRDGEESVRVTTDGGHQLEMRDPEGFVEIVTSAGQKIRMQDSPGQISLSTVAGTKVTIDDTPSQIELRTVTGVTLTVSDTGGVTVSAPVGAVSVNSLSADVTTTGSASVTASSMTVNSPVLSVNSAMASFTGVIQCTALLTQSVVSASYTPGVGNIW